MLSYITFAVLMFGVIFGLLYGFVCVTLWARGIPTDGYRNSLRPCLALAFGATLLFCSLVFCGILTF